MLMAILMALMSEKTAHQQDYSALLKHNCVAKSNVDDQGNSDPQYHSGWGEFYQFSTQDPCDKIPTNLYPQQIIIRT